MRDTDFYLGLIRLHVLYHASREPIFGLGIIRELARHGYELSPGTVYPLLHRMEERGYLKSQETLSEGRRRRMYRATARGKKVLAEAKTKVRELFRELVEEDS